MMRIEIIRFNGTRKIIATRNAVALFNSYAPLARENHVRYVRAIGSSGKILMQVRCTL